MTLSSSDARTSELRRLLAWGQASGPGAAAGFGYLGDDGTITPSEGLQLWITTRMTHVYGLAVMLGHPGARELASSGLGALQGVFHDDTHGGWYAQTTMSGEPVNTRKEMYGHAFVVLAGATARAAGLDGAETLLGKALDVVEHRFWDDEAGACRESWSQDWQVAEPYGGVNCNMHAVEAFLAAGAITGEAVWSDRALRIASRFIHGVAREHRWRIPEHFSQGWEVLPEYNADQPRHRFRPYGVTIGHLLEWSRLLLHVERAVDQAPAWLVADAVALFDTAVAIGWAADGRPGFVYTVDWSDRPVVAERMHWVAAEGAMTAEALTRRTGEERFAEWAERLWSDTARFVDSEAGGWWHELDPHGAVSRTVWSGKPDLYHAVQAMLLPDLPFTPSLVTSVLAAAPERSTRTWARQSQA